jgi:predicted DNA-binding ribbon-helix-helix protein
MRQVDEVTLDVLIGTLQDIRDRKGNLGVVIRIGDVEAFLDTVGSTDHAVLIEGKIGT